MPTLADIRAKFGPATSAFTDQEIYELAKEAYGPMYADEKSFNREFGYDPNSSNIVRGAKIGARGVAGGMAGFGALVADVVGAAGARDSLLGTAQDQQQKAFRLGRRSDDVDNFLENPTAFIASGVGQAAAYALPSLVAGGLPALGLRMAGATGARQLAGAAVGSFAGSNLPQEAGGIYNDLAEQGKYEPGRALLYGTGAAALDTATEALPFGSKFAGGALRRVGKGALTQAGTEALTETAQTAIERAGAYKSLTDPEAMHEYRNAAALGAIGGAGFGAYGGLRGGLPPKQPIADDKPTDLTATQGPPATPMLGWNGQLGTAINPVANPTPMPVYPGGAATPADVENMRMSGLGPRTYGLANRADQLGAVQGAGLSPEVLDATLGVSGPMNAKARTQREADILAAMSEPTNQRVAPMDAGQMERPVDTQELFARDAGPDTSRLAIIEAEKKYAARREAATDALIEKDPDGKPYIRINPREIETHTALVQLRDSGVITPEIYAEKVGQVREALKSEDKKTLNAVAKEVKTLAAQPAQGATNAQPDVPGAANVAAAPAGGERTDTAGSRRAVGSVSRVKGPGAVSPVAPVGSSAAPAPVAVGGTAGRADTLTAPPIAAPAGPKVTVAPYVEPAKPAAQKTETTDDKQFYIKFPRALDAAGVEDRFLIEQWLGAMSDGNGGLEHVDNGASYEEIGKALTNTKTGETGMSAQAVQKRIENAFDRMGAPAGISRKKLRERLGLQAAGTDLDTINRSSQQTTTDNVDEDPTELTSDLAIPDTAPAEETVGRERETTDEPIDDTADPANAEEAVDVPAGLESDLRAGRVTQDDIIEAEIFYSVNRAKGQPEWAQIPHVTRAAMVRAYASARVAGHPDVLAAKQVRKDYEDLGLNRDGSDPKAAQTAGGGEPSAGADAAQASGEVRGAGGSTVSKTGGTQPTVVVKKRRVIAKAPNDRKRVPGDNESTLVDREELLDHPEGKRATDWLNRLGIGHVTSWVSNWRVIDKADPAQGEVVAGYLEGTPDGYTLAVKPLDSEASMAGVITHELGHAVDLVPAGGVYSAHPAMAFDGFEPSGAVARELADVQNGDSPLAGVFEYPLDHEFHGVEASEMSGELFAELFSAFVHPKGNELLRVHAPVAYQFMKDVVNDIRQTKPLAKRSAVEQTARAEAFQKRVPVGVPVRGRSAAVGAAAGPARSTGDGAGANLDKQANDELTRQKKLEAAVRDTLGPKSKAGWTDLKNFFSRTAPYVMTNFQIYEQFKSKIKSLAAYVKTSDLMRVEAQIQQQAYDAVAEKWKSLPKPELRKLNKVAQRATLTEIHPDKAWDSPENAHVDRSKEDAYKELKAQYDALSPEAKAVYHDALKVMDAAHDRMTTALANMYESYGKTMPIAARLPGPYFPLMRFGEYLAIGESKAYKDAEAAAEGLEGDARKEAEAALNKMRQDRKHYIVSAHESRSGMEAALRAYESEGLDVRPSMADQRLQSMPTRNIHTTIASLTEAASRGLDSTAGDKIRKAIAEIVMRSLPEMHALQRQAERVGVEGAEPDMLRAFAAQGRSNAFYTARLTHAKDAADHLSDIKKEVKGDVDLMHVYRELEQRTALNLTFHDTPLQDKLSTAGYLWFLGSSPTYLVMQGLQTYLVAGPVLAGKYGGAKASAALATASAHAFKVLKDARFKDGKIDLWSGISENSIPGKSVSEDRKAIRELMSRGIIDEGLTFNLGMLAEGGSVGVLSKGVRAVGWMAQQIEMYNRVATGLAAFRLAREKGLSYDEAVESAYGDVVNTQMDYSQEGTARVMREGGGVPLAKLLFQFRRYQQAMFYLLADNIKKAFTNPAERRAALGTLGYLAVTTALSAGVMGLPFMGTALVIANLFRDKDDEEGDAQTVLRNALFDMTGDKDTATVLAKGIPALFGVDLSARIGLASVAQMYPRMDMGKTGAETIGNVAAAVAGPVLGGLGTQAVDAFLFASNGDGYKAAEKLLPKTASDVLRGSRYWSEGMTDRKGEQILSAEELGAWNAVVRMMGASSIDEANYYEGTMALKRVEEATKDRKAKIGQKYRAAMQNDDGMDRVRDLIDAYNEDHPDKPILPKDELSWRKDLIRSKQERDEVTGLKVGKRDRAYESVMRFAR